MLSFLLSWTNQFYPFHPFTQRTKWSVKYKHKSWNVNDVHMIVISGIIILSKTSLISPNLSQTPSSFRLHHNPHTQTEKVDMGYTHSHIYSEKTTQSILCYPLCFGYQISFYMPPAKTQCIQPRQTKFPIDDLLKTHQRTIIQGSQVDTFMERDNCKGFEHQPTSRFLF